MKNMQKLMLGGISVLVAAAVLTGCGSGAKPESKAPAEKTLRVGTEAAYPPFEFTKDNSNELQGFDIDLMNAAAKRAGYKVEWKNMGFDALIPALQSDQLDAAISGMSITDERKKIVNFSDAYYSAGSNAVFKVGADIHTAADLAGKTLAAQIGTTGADEAHTIPGATVKEFNSAPDALQEVLGGGSQVAIIDGPVAAYYLKLEPGKYEMFPTGTPEIPIGIAMNKNNTELLQKINTALADMKKDGEYAKIQEKWFGKVEK